MRVKYLRSNLFIFVVTSLISFSAIAETSNSSRVSCRLYRRAGTQVCGPVAKCDMTIKVKKDRRNRSIDQLSCGLAAQSSTGRQVYQSKRAKEVSLESLECKESEIKAVDSFCQGPTSTIGGETVITPNKVWVRTHPASCIAPAIYPSLPQLTSQKEFSVSGGKVRIADQLDGGCRVSKPSAF